MHMTKIVQLFDWSTMFLAGVVCLCHFLSSMCDEQHFTKFRYRKLIIQASLSIVLAADLILRCHWLTRN